MKRCQLPPPSIASGWSWCWKMRPDVRQTLCEQLHQLGYLTLEADNGEQALNMLEASPDIGMFITT